jgi:hypothetical protein
MPVYRCYLLDSNDRINAPPEIIEADTAADAVHIALSLCKAAPEGCEGIELWEGEALVMTRPLRADAAN